MRFRAIEDFDYEWLKGQIGLCWTEDTSGIIVDNGHGTVPLGAAVSQLWTEKTVTAHMCATTPMVWRFGLHKEFFDYVFNITEREWIFGQVEGDKKMAISMDQKFGFKIVDTIPDGFRPGCDMIIMKMHRDWCNYLKKPVRLKAVEYGR